MVPVATTESTAVSRRRRPVSSTSQYQRSGLYDRCRNLISFGPSTFKSVPRSVPCVRSRSAAAANSSVSTAAFTSSSASANTTSSMCVNMVGVLSSGAAVSSPEPFRDERAWALEPDSGRRSALKFMKGMRLSTFVARGGCAASLLSFTSLRCDALKRSGPGAAASAKRPRSVCPALAERFGSVWRKAKGCDCTAMSSIPAPAGPGPSSRRSPRLDSSPDPSTLLPEALSDRDSARRSERALDSILAL